MATGKKNYFRHYFGANRDEKLMKVIDELGFDGLGKYWILVELCAEKASESSTDVVTFHKQTLRNVWRTHTKSVDKVLTKLQQSGLFSVTFTNNSVQIKFPNILKYIGKYSTEIDSETPNKKKRKEKKVKEIKTKEITEAKASSPSSKKPSPRGCIAQLSGNSVIENILSSVTTTSQKAWLDCYADAEFLKAEILKAHVWIEANPKRRPKLISRFLSSWFTRAWERHRKTVPTTQTISGDWRKLAGVENEN